jgi:hypothetical protein
MFDRSLLTFHPPHIHKYDGKRLLGVTTALSAISKGDGLTQWAVNCALDYARANLEAFVEDNYNLYNAATDPKLPITDPELKMILAGAKFAWRNASAEAAKIGTIAHEWIENYLAGVEPLDWPEDPNATRSCEAALEWIQSVKWKTIKSEYQICIPDLEVGGICDWYAEIDGVPSVVDWKTSKSLHSTYAYQLAAYAKALEEEFQTPIRDRWLIRIDKETGSVSSRYLPPETLEKDYQAFVGAVHIYRREADIKKEWS